MLSPGSRLGPYEVLALLGKGGMGEVWRARDTKLSGQPAFDVRADGRILFSAQEGLTTAGDAFDDFRRVNVVVNWFQELLARVPVD